MKDLVLRLQQAMREMPQLEMRTDHHFARGLYARVLHIPAGTLIVGKIHKEEHFFIIAKGSIRVTADEYVRDLVAGDVLVASPGTKRAGLALEDCVCINVHHTMLTDLDEIEEELIEPDETALFDARNKVKELPCPG